MCEKEFNQNNQNEEVLEENSAEEINDVIEENSEENELVKLQNELKESNDKYLRTLAEYDNFRKRTAKEKSEVYSDATSKAVLEILPVLDNFERAFACETKDESFKNGMVMIFNQFNEILKKLGVEEIDALNQPFDPNLHYAVNQVEDENFDKNTICQVFQKGYRMNDRVIRYSMVVVANP